MEEEGVGLEIGNPFGLSPRAASIFGGIEFSEMFPGKFKLVGVAEGFGIKLEGGGGVGKGAVRGGIDRGGRETREARVGKSSGLANRAVITSGVNPRGR